MARRGKRDTTSLSLTSLLAPPPLVSPATYDLVRLMALQEVEDNRLFHPDGSDRAARTSRGTGSRQAARAARRTRHAASVGALYHAPSHIIGFINKPWNPVVHCVRRKVRREVLHALKRTRSGRGGRKRRNWRSDIKC